MSKVDKNLERIELLSSPFIDKDYDTLETSQECQDTDNDSEAAEDNTFCGRRKASRRNHHHSPMRLRDRLANFFGYRNSVDDQLKKLADDEELDQEPQDKEREPSLHDTIKSDETRGSSLINEQTTYYNTLRNKYIQDIPGPDKVKDEIPAGLVPASRYFLSVYPHQQELFATGKELIKKHSNNYPMNYKWNLWSDSASNSPQSRPGTSNSTTYALNESQQRRKLHLEYQIETKMDLTETIIAYKRKLKNQSECFQIHIFKDGVKPKTTSESLEEGGVIALQVPLKHGYPLWKNILRIEVDDQFQHNEDPKVFKLKNMINGISFILKDDTMSKKFSSNNKVVLLKLWLQPIKPSKRIPKETTAALCHLLEENFDVSLHQFIKTAMFVDHTTSEIYKVFG